MPEIFEICKEFSLSILLVLFIPALLMSQDISQIEGNWNGSIQIQGQELGIKLIFTYSENELDGSLDIPEQGAFNLPVDVLKISSDSLNFEFQTGSGPATFYGERQTDESAISGVFNQSGMKFPFSIRKTGGFDQNDTALPESEIIIPNDEFKIAGSLVNAGKQTPLVVLLTGSGSQDRNETIANFEVFRKLAIHLYEKNISTFRYDDRGVGGSTGREDATIEELASDLRVILDYMTGENNFSDFSSVFLLGHSQGGLIASLSSSHSSVNGILLMAAPFFRGDEIINQQILQLSDLQDIPENIVEVNLQFQDKIYETVRNDGDWSVIENDLADRMKQQIEELPEQQRESLGNMDSFIRRQVLQQLSSAKTDWFRSFINFDPTNSYQAIQKPTLVLFGGKDVQVDPDKNEEAARQLFRDVDFKIDIKTIEEANHLFQKAETGHPSEYGILDHNFTDEFIEQLTEFIYTVSGN